MTWPDWIVVVAIVITAISETALWITKRKRLKKQRQWVSIQVGTEVHTVPNMDIFLHTPNDECGCKPVTEPVPRLDGSYGWIVTHNAMDGRTN